MIAEDKAAIARAARIEAAKATKAANDDRITLADDIDRGNKALEAAILRAKIARTNAEKAKVNAEAARVKADEIAKDVEIAMDKIVRAKAKATNAAMAVMAAIDEITRTKDAII